jgi:hypothetical protein
LRLNYKRPLYYKIIKNNTCSTIEITNQLKSIVHIESTNFLKQWKTVEKFHYTYLNGNVYGSEITKGEIIVVKCGLYIVKNAQKNCLF